MINWTLDGMYQNATVFRYNGKMSRGAGIRKVIMVVHIALHLVHDCSSSLRVSVLGALFWLGWNQMTLWFGVTIAHLGKKKKKGQPELLSMDCHSQPTLSSL